MDHRECNGHGSIQIFQAIAGVDEQGRVDLAVEVKLLLPRLGIPQKFRHFTAGAILDDALVGVDEQGKVDFAAGIHRVSAPPFRDTGEIPPFRTLAPLEELRLVRTLPAQYTGTAGESQTVTALWGSGNARNLNVKEYGLWVQSGVNRAEAVPVQNDTFSGVCTVNSQPQADTERTS